MNTKAPAVTNAERLPGGAPTKWAKVKKNLTRNFWLYMFLLPTIIWYVLFCYLPMGGIYIAFTRFKGVGNYWEAKFVGLKWFKSFFGSVYAKTVITNTMLISVYSLVTFPIAVIVALFFNELKNEKFKKVTQTIMYAPHFVSVVVLVSMMNLFFAKSGLVNNVIEALGGDRISFMSSAKAYPHMFVWSGVWQGLGWSTIIYVAALSSVDPGLHEAATLDGASRIQRIVHINLPTIAPTIIITLIMRVGSLLSVSTDKGLLMKNDLNIATSEIIGTFVYERGLIAGDYSYSTAVGLFTNVVNLVLLLTVNWISKKVSETSLL